MVRLDDLRWSAHRARFDHVGIERPLYEPIDFAFFFFNALGLVVKDGDEFVADNLAFRFRIGNARQSLHEAVGCIDCNQAQSKVVAQVLLHFLEFVLAKDSVVNENARQLRLAGGITQCSIDQHRCNGGVHAAGEGADGVAAADLRLDCGHRRIDEMLSRPGGWRAANLQREIAQDVRAERCVVHFGMKLHSPHLLRDILDRCDGVRSLRRERKSGREFFRGIAVRHPYGKSIRCALKQA